MNAQDGVEATLSDGTKFHIPGVRLVNRSEPNVVCVGRVCVFLHSLNRPGLVVNGVELTPTEVTAMQRGLGEGRRVEIG